MQMDAGMCSKERRVLCCWGWGGKTLPGLLPHVDLNNCTDIESLWGASGEKGGGGVFFALLVPGREMPAWVSANRGTDHVQFYWGC